MLDFISRNRTACQNRKTKNTAASLPSVVEPLESRCLLTAAPIGVTAMGVSATAILVKWTASTDTTVTGYDVFDREWVSNGGGKGSHGGHYVYTEVGANLTTPSETVGGLVSGSYHTYLITAVSPAGQSAYSTPVTAETWLAPSLPYGSEYLLSSGALWSGPLSVTAGLTTQITILGAGNPLKYSIASGPKTASVNSTLGFVTYTPALTEVGTVSVAIKVSNALGSATQTVQFTVAAPAKLPKPKLALIGTSITYDGQYHGVSATAVTTTGTPVAGSFAFAFNGSTGSARNVGTYTVLATFTSADPKYASATLLGKLTITKAKPVFSALISPTEAIGTPSTVFSGNLAAGLGLPTGDNVTVTLNGVAQTAVVDANGNFTTTFDTSLLKLGTYTVSYAYAGDANLSAATAASKLTIIPTAPPKVTLNPKSITVTAGDGATLTAAATGVNAPTVQWQVSTDGGATYANVYSLYGDTLVISNTNANMNGYLYRAVFTNASGTATTTAAKLTVELDSGGD